MGTNVFGNPITNLTLEGMPKFAVVEGMPDSGNPIKKRTITPKDRAGVAVAMKNANGNDINVRSFVQNVGITSGSMLTTHVLIYNATGDTITLVESHDWHGHLAESPYPAFIANGQWGGFVHVKPKHKVGSHGAVLYAGKNDAEQECRWLLSWENPYNQNYDNLVYTEVGTHPLNDWGRVYSAMENPRLHAKTDTRNGCRSSASTGRGHKAFVEAIFTLQ